MFQSHCGAPVNLYAIAVAVRRGRDLLAIRLRSLRLRSALGQSRLDLIRYRSHLLQASSPDCIHHF
jgi:hypothetical protein